MDSYIEVMRCVGRWMEIVVEEDKPLEGCVLQSNDIERMGIQDLDEEFQEGLIGLQER